MSSLYLLLLLCCTPKDGSSDDTSTAGEVDFDEASAACLSGSCPAWVTESIDAAEASSDPYLVEYLVEALDDREVTAAGLLEDPAWVEFAIALIDALLAHEALGEESAASAKDEHDQDDDALLRDTEDALDFFRSGEAHPLNFADEIVAIGQAAQRWAAEAGESLRAGLEAVRGALSRRLDSLRAVARDSLQPLHGYVKAELAFQRCLVFAPTEGSWLWTHEGFEEGGEKGISTYVSGTNIIFDTDWNDYDDCSVSEMAFTCEPTDYGGFATLYMSGTFSSATQGTFSDRRVHDTTGEDLEGIEWTISLVESVDDRPCASD